MLHFKHVLFLMLFLSSTNAFADVGSLIISNEFPANALMLENHEYKNSAVYQNTGVYDGSVYASALYEDSVYNCSRGYFLPHLSESCNKCPANSYCPGGEYTYSASADQGINVCPAEHPAAPMGMWLAGQCGRKIFFDGENTNNFLYVHQIPADPTAHRFFVRVDGNVYSANMVLRDNAPGAEFPKMSENAERGLHVKMKETVNGVEVEREYLVHDDSAG